MYAGSRLQQVEITLQLYVKCSSSYKSSRIYIYINLPPSYFTCKIQACLNYGEKKNLYRARSDTHVWWRNFFRIKLLGIQNELVFVTTDLCNANKRQSWLDMQRFSITFTSGIAVAFPPSRVFTFGAPRWSPWGACCPPRCSPCSQRPRSWCLWLPASQSAALQNTTGKEYKIAC